MINRLTSQRPFIASGEQESDASLAGSHGTLDTVKVMRKTPLIPGEPTGATLQTLSMLPPSLRQALAASADSHSSPGKDAAAG